MSRQKKTVSEPSLWRRIWSPPEAEISTVGFSGELLVAGARLLIVTALLYFPLRELLRGPGGSEPLVLLSTATAGLVLALMVYSATNRHWGRAWIGFASSLLDVSLVSGMLTVFLALGRPLEATNDLMIFPVYVLAIAATSLRYDSRICVVTGALAVAQYTALVLYADWRWDLSSPALGARFGAFSWSAQVWRLVQIAGATLISATVVVRSRELRLLSTRDRFTGLLNRAVFNEQLEREVDIGRRDNTRFAVAMLDIDHFKRFNDTYGHAGGDEALREVAKTLRESCRATDVVARYGGEEFALILPGAMGGRATDLLEQRIRRVLAVKPIYLAGRSKPASVTVSIGVAIWPDDGESPSEILRCADQRLYQAKEQGRDRVVGPAASRARSSEERLREGALP